MLAAVHFFSLEGLGSCCHRESYDAGIISRKGLRQLILLPFLQQIEIKSLLYLLLALHTQQIFSLLRIGCYFGGGLTSIPLLAFLSVR